MGIYPPGWGSTVPAEGCSFDRQESPIVNHNWGEVNNFNLEGGWGGFWGKGGFRNSLVEGGSGLKRWTGVWVQCRFLGGGGLEGGGGLKTVNCLLLRAEVFFL